MLLVVLCTGKQTFYYECDLFSGSFRAAVVKLLELRASVSFPQQMKKVEANRCLSVLTGRRKESGLFEAQGAAESGQTEATWGYQRTFPIYSSHTENNKPVSVKSTLCEENTEPLDNLTFCLKSKNCT